MIDTRNIAYEQRTTAMKQVLDDVDMDALEAKVLDNETHLTQSNVTKTLSRWPLPTNKPCGVA